MGKIIAIVNQKGGVGKTTTAVNLSSCIADKNKKVLLIDIDPQGNATLGLGLDKNDSSDNIYNVFVGETSVGNVIKKTKLEYLDIVPSNIQLTGAEIELVGIEKKEIKLKNAISEIKDRYDYVFIDAPPSLGIITLNALTAADSVLIPIQAEFYALDGLAQLLNTISLVKDSLNKNIFIEGVLITMFDSRTNLSLQVVEEVRKKFKERVYKNFIPRNIRLSEAPSFGQPINVYDKNSKGAIAYMGLAEEILNQK